MTKKSRLKRPVLRGSALVASKRIKRQSSKPVLVSSVPENVAPPKDVQERLEVRERAIQKYRWGGRYPECYTNHEGDCLEDAFSRKKIQICVECLDSSLFEIEQLQESEYISDKPAVCAKCKEATWSVEVVYYFCRTCLKKEVS